MPDAVPWIACSRCAGNDVPTGFEAPALVCAFKGWNDAGESATSALAFVAGSLGAESFATIDPEEFVDFQTTRPMVRLEDGITRTIDWPEFEIHAVRIPRAPRDLILLSGPEPAFRWRTFSRTVVDLAEALGVQMAVLLGALLADVPHSRPCRRHRARHRPGPDPAARAHAADLRGPDRHRRRPPPRVRRRRPARPRRLWAAVPHYVAVAPNPKGALALLRRLESLVGVTVDATDLEDAATEYESQVSRAVELDPDVQAFVERLERAADEESGPSGPGQRSRPATCSPASSSASSPARGE